VSVLIDRRGTAGALTIILRIVNPQAPALPILSPLCGTFTKFHDAGIMIASVNGRCVAEISELPYDGNMWAAVCLKSPRQKVTS
jgi:hypothetical protein